MSSPDSGRLETVDRIEAEPPPAEAISQRLSACWRTSAGIANGKLACVPTRSRRRASLAWSERGRKDADLPGRSIGSGLFDGLTLLEAKAYGARRILVADA
jgi:hypothetical protein